MRVSAWSQCPTDQTDRRVQLVRLYSMLPIQQAVPLFTDVMTTMRLSAAATVTVELRLIRYGQSPTAHVDTSLDVQLAIPLV